MPNHEFSDSPAPRREKGSIFESHIPRSTQSASGSEDALSKSPKVTWDIITPNPTVIKVIGVGGGGGNAVQSMADEGFSGVEFYAINTDYQALQRCRVPNRIQIGEKLTHGSGAGSMPNIGEQAARDAEEQIRQILSGADMVFITAGMGGGTGTGAAPVIAEIARSMNILNVAIVTKPFHFEGAQRMRRAVEGIHKLSEHVDTMITILNDKLMEVVGPKTPLCEAFDVANSVLSQGIRAISDLIAKPGLINVDFRDVRTIMGQTGGAVMGVGEGKGENRAVEAVRKACHSPLQEKIVIDGAKGVLINITGPPNVTMHEINEATSLVYDAADPDATVIFGVVVDENMQDSMRVTIIATGFGSDGTEMFGSAKDEKLHARPNRLPLGNGNPFHSSLLGNGSEGHKHELESSLLKPSILTKRERDNGTAVPKMEFEPPPSPTNGWDKPAESKFEEPAPKIAEPIGAAKSLVFSDSVRDGQDRQDGAEDPYEIPALQRRRHRRFFE